MNRSGLKLQFLGNLWGCFNVGFIILRRTTVRL